MLTALVDLIICHEYVWHVNIWWLTMNQNVFNSEICPIYGRSSAPHPCRTGVPPFKSSFMREAAQMVQLVRPWPDHFLSFVI